MQDNHRSDIFLTLWGSAVQIPEQLNMVKGTFIALRNFKVRVGNIYWKHIRLVLFLLKANIHTYIYI